MQASNLIQKMSSVRLTSAEEMQVVRLTAPAPSSAERLIDLLGPLAHANIQAYAEAASAEKVALLKDRGLQEEAVLRNQLTVGAEQLDVIVLSNCG